MSRHFTQEELDAYGSRRKEDIVTALPENELERLVAIIEAREESRTTGALDQAYADLGAELTKYSLMFDKIETAATRQREAISQLVLVPFGLFIIHPSCPDQRKNILDIQ